MFILWGKLLNNPQLSGFFQFYVILSYDNKRYKKANKKTDSHYGGQVKTQMGDNKGYSKPLIVKVDKQLITKYIISWILFFLSFFVLMI